MSNIRFTIFRIVRKLYRLLTKTRSYKDNYGICCDLVEYSGEEAQSYIKKRMECAYNDSKGLMLAKFGTYELYTLLLYLYEEKKCSTLKGAWMLNSSLVFISLKDSINNMHINAGVFPATLDAVKKTAERYWDDISSIDILVSYQSDEKYLKGEMQNCTYVDFYSISPFMYPNPWTEFLRDKKVLVIHPFVESIKYQYNKNREKIFDNPNVLPNFKSLSFIKAIQSAAGEVPEGINNWSEALELMERQIDDVDFDVAIIGCGAYGLPLASYVKRLGKIGIHLASMTQMLFGVYGERWIKDQPDYCKFINKYWIRPNSSETPQSSNLIENGCYW